VIDVVDGEARRIVEVPAFIVAPPSDTQALDDCVAVHVPEPKDTVPALMMIIPAVTFALTDVLSSVPATVNPDPRTRLSPSL
jgi:hypothetical protein